MYACRYACMYPRPLTSASRSLSNALRCSISAAASFHSEEADAAADPEMDLEAAEGPEPEPEPEADGPPDEAAGNRGCSGGAGVDHASAFESPYRDAEMRSEPQVRAGCGTYTCTYAFQEIKLFTSAVIMSEIIVCSCYYIALGAHHGQMWNIVIVPQSKGVVLSAHWRRSETRY